MPSQLGIGWTPGGPRSADSLQAQSGASTGLEQLPRAWCEWELGLVQRGHAEQRARAITLPLCMARDPLSRRVTLSPRQGLLRIPLRGIFQGAMVVRGPDWEWGSQDGEWGRAGEVGLGWRWLRLSRPGGPGLACWWGHCLPRRGREARSGGGHPWLGRGDRPERGQRHVG